MPPAKGKEERLRTDGVSATRTGSFMGDRIMRYKKMKEEWYRNGKECILNGMSIAFAKEEARKMKPPWKEREEVMMDAEVADVSKSSEIAFEMEAKLIRLNGS